MTKGSNIDQTVVIPNATAEDIFMCLTQADKFRNFSGGPYEGEPVVGKEFSVYDGYATGVHKELVPGKLVKQTWRANTWPAEFNSTCTYELKNVAGGCEIHFTQEGVPPSEHAALEEGWHTYYWQKLKDQFGAEPPRKRVETESDAKSASTATAADAPASGESGAHAVCHFDLCATDMARAQKFYTDLFGWTFTAFDPSYATFDTGAKTGNINGGLAKVDAVQSGGVAGVAAHIHTRDIHDMAKRIEAAGGKIAKQPYEIGPGIGWNCYFYDIEGNYMALWQEDVPSGAQPKMEADKHALCHLDIPATNLDRVQKFYTDVFNWKITPWRSDYLMFETGAKAGNVNGGILLQEKVVNHRGKGTRAHILVSDIKEAVEKVKRAGGRIDEEPFSVGGFGMNAFFTDPEGNCMGLWQSLRQVPLPNH